MFLIDSNVLIDVVTANPIWRPWSDRALADAKDAGIVCINPIVHAEVAVAYPTFAAAEAALQPFGLGRLNLPYEAAFIAAKAHLQYRRAGGVRRSTLPDFLIGAHALHLGATLVTRDPRPHRTYFPTLNIIAPALP